MINFDALVKFHVLDKLGEFENMNYSDPLVVTGINATVFVALMEIQDQHPDFDGDVLMEYDPEPVFKVFWWLSKGKKPVQVVQFRFNPIRLDSEREDLVAAYDRAMKII